MDSITNGAEVSTLKIIQWEYMPVQDAIWGLGNDSKMYAYDFLSLTWLLMKGELKPTEPVKLLEVTEKEEEEDE